MLRIFLVSVTNASFNGKNFHSFFQNLNDGNDLPIPTISSRFYDVPLLISNFSKSTKPILASLNIQSLMSKHSEPKDFLSELSAKKYQKISLPYRNLGPSIIPISLTSLALNSSINIGKT